MGMDPRKHQKKLEKRKAKQKAERHETARRETQGFTAQFKEAASSPILHCYAADDIWSAGIGQLLVSRQLQNGFVAFSVFLVDIYCLGVKDVFMNIAPSAAYEWDLYGKLTKQCSLIRMKPECARKFIEGAVKFASELGLSPHQDYQKAAIIFGDIRAEDCTKEFEYGKDGRPIFIPGPYDSPRKCKQIIDAIQDHLENENNHKSQGLSHSSPPKPFLSFLRRICRKAMRRLP
jgi:hypothetical protein